MKKMLIVSYSYTNGNTERIAETLQEATGADLVRLKTVDPYPDDYDTTVEQAKREVEAGYLPAIERVDADVTAYDVIAIGTPTWWYTMAPTVATFISEHDWVGKTIVPFMTNAGWPGTVIEDIAEACAGATAVEALEVLFDATGGDTLKTPEHEVDAWAQRVARLLQD